MTNEFEQPISQKTMLEAGYKTILIKGLYLIVFLVVSYVAIFVTFFVVLFQYIAELILKRPNDHLKHFGDTLGLYACAVIRYLTGATDEMPFPFKPWPKGSYEKFK